MRVKKTVRPKKPSFAQYVDRVTRSARNMSTRTIWIAVCAVFGAAVLIGAATSGGPQDKAASHAAAKPPTTAAAATVTGASVDPVVPPATPTAADAVATAGVRAAPLTTITGCLEREDAAYRLKDTDGEAAPKARSWKTGFLKKGTRPIDLYDTANRAKLPTHVGQRISVTGELVDREMYVRSVQRVSPSCSTKS